MSTLVHKKTISLKSNIYDKLSKYPIKNKSSIINEALDLYFRKQEAIKLANKQFWEEEINSSLNDYKNWKFETINPHNEKITNELLEKNLRSKK